MRLKVISTGSKGNCYMLEADGQTLILDAGVSWSKILPNLPRRIDSVAGCLVTHEHLDHAKAVPDLIRHSINVALSKGTLRAISERKPEAYVKARNKLYTVGIGDCITFSTFTIMPFQAEHDANEPLGFLIRHDPTGDTALYATDTYRLLNRYPGVNYWLIECNYVMELAETLLEEPGKEFLFERLVRSHMSLDRLCNSLKANDLSKTRKIVLVHISQERGDPERMVDEVRSVTGIDTIAAIDGLDIELGSCPF